MRSRTQRPLSRLRPAPHGPAPPPPRTPTTPQPHHRPAAPQSTAPRGQASSQGLGAQQAGSTRHRNGPERVKDRWPGRRERIDDLEMAGPGQLGQGGVISGRSCLAGEAAAHRAGHPVVVAAVHNTQPDSQRNHPRGISRRVTFRLLLRAAPEQMISRVVTEALPGACGQITHRGQRHHPGNPAGLGTPWIPGGEQRAPGRPQRKVPPSGMPGEHDPPVAGAHLARLM